MNADVVIKVFATVPVAHRLGYADIETACARASTHRRHNKAAATEGVHAGRSLDHALFDQSDSSR
jgi:hypothetical protein